MARWECSIKPSDLENARACIGALADQVFEVEADNADEAIVKAEARISEQRPMTGMPADSLEDWLEARPLGE